MKRSIALGLSLALFPPLAAAAVAQAPGPSEFLQVLTVTVKPEAVTDYEDYVKKVVASAAKTPGFPRVVTYQVTMGGPSYTYNFVLPFNKWADLDGWTPLSRALATFYGEAEAARIGRAGRSAVVHSESIVHRLLRDLSTKPRSFDPPAPFVFVVRTEVDPAMQRSYEEYLSKLKTAQEQSPDSPTAIRRVSALGPALTYSTAQFFTKHADRDAWTPPGDALRKAHGEAEGRRLLEEGARAVRRREIYVLAFRPDLSALVPMAAR